MKFKLDENLPTRAVDALRAAGHDAVHLLDQVAAGLQDAGLAQLTRNEGRALITLDLDFADIRTYQPRDYPGLIVLRPRTTSADDILRLLTRLIDAVAREPVAGCLWIVDEHRIRILEDSS